LELSAGRKLTYGTMLVVVLALVQGIISFWVVNDLGQQLDQAVNRNARQQLLAGQISTSASDLDAAERGLAMAMMLQQTQVADQLRRDITGLDESIDKQIRELRSTAGEGAAGSILNQLGNEFTAFRQLHQQVLRSLEGQKMDEALGTLNSSLLPRLSQMNRAAKKVLEDQNTNLAALRSSAEKKRSISLYLVGAFCVLTLVIGLGVQFNVRSIYGVLRKTVGELNDNARELAGASTQVSDASQSISQAAGEQAKSLEQTSSSAEQIHAMTRRNLEHAESAARRTHEASGVIQEANRALSQMVVSMNEISNSSSKISKIIKVIDEIAFQTNILALNAAVEAARAGEAGMGFAVVADEVRNLAQRSAQAAKDTTQLIEESIGRSAEGKQKLDEVAQAIASVTESSNNVRSLVENVHLGSEQQAKGIEQIARAVSRMEQVTQQLAASAEQGAAAGENLKHQARAVDDIGQALHNLLGASGQVQLAMDSPRPIGSRRRPQAHGNPQNAEQLIPFEEVNTM